MKTESKQPARSGPQPYPLALTITSRNQSPTTEGPEPSKSSTPAMAAFAESLLGWKLEEKQRELLTGPHRRVILNCTRQWGKSWMAAVALLFHANHLPESLSIVAGPTLRQSAELLRKVKELAWRLGLPTSGDTINRHSLVLPNRSRLVAVPGNSPDAIRGFSSVTMLVIDEAAMVKDSVYTAVRPMLTQKDGAIWLLSTPKDMDGFYFSEFSEGKEDWRRVVVPATECPRFQPQQLEAEKASLGARLFAQEFLCQFVATSDGLFDQQWLDDVFCSTPPLAPLPTVAIGL